MNTRTALIKYLKKRVDKIMREQWGKGKLLYIEEQQEKLREEYKVEISNMKNVNKNNERVREGRNT